MILQDKNTPARGSSYHKRVSVASKTILEKNNDVVIKRFLEEGDRFSSPDDWLIEYNKLRKWDNRYIEVYDVGNNFIKMKYIPTSFHFNSVMAGDTFHDIDVRLRLISDYIDILSTAHCYVSESNSTFIHNDLHPSNIMVDEKNKLVIIDPDSCDKINMLMNPQAVPKLISYYSMAIHTYYNLLCVGNKVVS